MDQRLKTTVCLICFFFLLLLLIFSTNSSGNSNPTAAAAVLLRPQEALLALQRLTAAHHPLLLRVQLQRLQLLRAGGAARLEGGPRCLRLLHTELGKGMKDKYVEEKMRRTV